MTNRMLLPNNEIVDLQVKEPKMLIKFHLKFFSSVHFL